MMAEDGLHQQTTQGEKDLAVKFWSLVVLTKFLVFVLGIGLIVLAYTEYHIVGLLVTSVVFLIGVRWLRIYRAAQADIQE